jgi:hypothetical protein
MTVHLQLKCCSCLFSKLESKVAMTRGRSHRARNQSSMAQFKQRTQLGCDGSCSALISPLESAKRKLRSVPSEMCFCCSRQFLPSCQAWIMHVIPVRSVCPYRALCYWILSVRAVCAPSTAKKQTGTINRKSTCHCKHVHTQRVAV